MLTASVDESVERCSNCKGTNEVLHLHTVGAHLRNTLPGTDIRVGSVAVHTHVPFHLQQQLLFSTSMVSKLGDEQSYSIL